MASELDLMAEMVISTMKRVVTPLVTDLKAIQLQLETWESRWSDVGALRERLAVLEVKSAPITVFDVDRKAYTDMLATLEKRVEIAEQRPMVPGPRGENGIGEPGPPGLNGKDADPMILADALKTVGTLREDVAVLKQMGWKADLAIVTQTVDSLKASIAEARAPIQGPIGPQGLKGDPGQAKEVDPLVLQAFVEASVARAVSQLPVPMDVTSVTVADLTPVIVAEVQKTVALIPPAKNGESGQPVDLALIEGLVKAQVQIAVSELPAPKDGLSVTVDDVAPLIADQVERAVAKLPRAKDGIGVLGALIDREGHLVLTLSDGGVKDLGSVVGKDGLNGLNGKDLDHAEMTKQIAVAVALLPKPKDGKDGLDGLGFDELTGAFDDEQGFVLRFQRGDQTKDVPLGTPFDTGAPWEAGRRYVKGAGVRIDGSWWIAQQPNVNVRPGSGTPASVAAWRLAVKRGNDGKPGKDGKDGGDL